MKKLETLTFKKFCMTIGNLPSSYVESLSYYECLMWLCNYLQTEVIPTVNNNSEAVEELQGLFIQLQQYVENYFDNLDIQDEINNKLDEMVEDGTLEEIIGSYISKELVHVYSTESEAISDTSLTSDMVIKILGKETENDGNGGLYKVVDEEPTPLNNVTDNNNLDNYYLTLENGLYAIRLDNINNDYYDEVTVEYTRYNDTDTYITTIPLNDDEGNEIELYVKNNSGMNISDYARNHHTTLSMNIALGVENPDTHLSENASVISNGEVINDNMNPPEFLDDHYQYIAIKDNRVFTQYQANETTTAQMLSAGVKYAWLCFGQLVDNGIATDYCTGDDPIITSYYPRQVIGVKPDKTVIILTCDGRTTSDRGLTGQEVAQKMISLGCTNVWNLDGGGSTDLIYKGSKINKNIDDRGLTERHIVYNLSVKKPTKNKNIDDSFNNIGIEKERIIRQLLPTIPRMLMKNFIDLNTLTTSTNMYSIYNATNYPSGADKFGYLLVLPIASTDNELYGKYCKQIYLSRLKHNIWSRECVNEVWTDWVEVSTSVYAGEFEVTSNQSMGIGVNYAQVAIPNGTSEYMNNYLTCTDNKIYTSKASAAIVNAVFTVTCELDGTMAIRIRKNGTGAAQVIQFTGVAGQQYNVSIQKMLSLNAGDYIDFTSNGGTNTGGVNKIFLGNINIIQNI